MNEVLLTIYRALSVRSERLVAFEGRHLFFFALVLLCSILLVKFFRNCSFCTFRIVLFFLWLIIFILEILRQFVYCVRYDHVSEAFTYQLRTQTLPLQLCAMQHYILPAILLLPRGKACDTALLFMATYSFFGGLVVMLLPETIASTNAFIDVQGLLHHGIQCVAGVFIIAHEHMYIEKKIFFYNFLLFLSMVGMALFVNEYTHDLAVTSGGVALDLFMLSPYATGGQEIVKQLRAALTHPQFVIGYILLLTAASHLLYAILSFIFRKTDKRYISKWR